MKRILTQVLALITLGSFAYGQAGETALSFEAADVHVSPRSANPNVQSLGGFARDPRLKQADPASRATCKRNVAANATGLPLATLTCQNTTLAQLAEKLPAMAPAYVDHPAIDSSGLDGGWDFALSWTPRANFDGGQGQQPGAAGASDPNGGLSLFEGVQRLGLKLELQKHPYPVLVIDPIEQKPSDN